MDRIAALTALGVRVHHQEIWVGEVGTPERRPEAIKESMRSVLLPLSPEDWSRTCMRDGDMYVGGCCGTTAAMQDIMNSVFRDSGQIDNAELYQLGQLARSHDGFDSFKDLADDEFAAYLAGWEALDPWDKVGLVYQATAPYLKPHSYDLPQLGREEAAEKESIRALQSALTQLRWSDLFVNDDDGTEQRQRHSNRVVLLARALGPTRQLLAVLESESEDFDGYALLDKGDGSLLVNGYGTCLYRTEAEAQEVLDLWTRLDNEDADEDDEEDSSGEPRLSERAILRPVKVSGAAGVELR